MINIAKLASDIAGDIAIAGQSCREFFWDIADVAWHVRSQFRRRHTVWSFAEREQDLYRQLGRDGYTLLVDGVSVQRTPHLDTTIKAIRNCETMRHQVSRGLANTPWDVRTSVSARRLTHFVRTRSWQIHAVAVPERSPWIGRSLPLETPTGLCVAVRRDQSVHPFTPDWRLLDGDHLMVLTPPANSSDWDQWITRGPADATDTR
jgi:hypothetical protein